MKAAICHRFGEPLVVEEMDLDPPGPGEVRVRVAACAICHSDIHYMDGAWGGELPAVYGHEAAGVVEEIGPGVSLARVGEPAVVSLLRACGHCYFCARGEPNECETRFPLDEQFRIRSRDGRQVHQGLRTGAFAEQGLGLLRRAGTLVIVGMPPSGATFAVEAVALADRGQRILGSKMGSTRPRIELPELVALYQQGRLKLDELISARYPLEGINEAIADVRAGVALRNVIVF